MGILLSLLCLGWQGFAGCAGVGVRCEDKVCLVTSQKRCTANKDCCCKQSCVLGCCLLPGESPSGVCLGSDPGDGGVWPEGVRPDCDNGEKRDCFPGNPAARGVGLCQAGTQSCSRGQWGPCKGYVLPQAEKCDGKDNDCDGAVDEKLAGCSCKNKESRPCGRGDCAGKQSCDKGQWGPCVPNKTSPEVCDGKDNDCDGLVDEGARCPEIAAAMLSGSEPLVQFWDSRQQRTLRLLADNPSHKGPIRALAFRPDGKQMATASEDQQIRLWHPGEGSLQRTLGNPPPAHDDKVLALAYAPQGDLLASGDASGEIRLWETASGKLLHTLKGHAGPVISLLFFDEGKQLASAGEGGKILFWEVESGKKNRDLDPANKTKIVQLSLSANGKILAAIVGNKLRLWEWRQGKNLRQYSLPQPLTNLAFSPHNNNVLLSTTANEIQRWDISLKENKPYNRWPFSWATLNLPRGITLHHQGNLLALIGTPQPLPNSAPAVYLFDLRSPALAFRLDNAWGEATAVAFRP